LKPDFQRDGVELYCGDCLDVLPTLDGIDVDAIITDPPFNAGKKTVIETINKAKELVNDNPAQVARFESVGDLKDEWLEKAGEFEINLKRRVDSGELPPAALKNILEGKTIEGKAQASGHRAGKDMMDEMRVILDEIMGLETALMESRVQENEQTAASAKNAALFGTLFAILVGIGIIVFLLKTLMGQLGAEPSDLKDVAQKIADGDLKAQLSGNIREGTLAGSIKQMVDELLKNANAITSVAKGDLNVDVTVKSDNDILAIAVKNLRDNIEKILSDNQNLIKQALSGQLDARVDDTTYTGAWKEMMSNTNKLLETITEPIQEAMKVMSKAANKILTTKVEGNYNGQLKEFKNNINQALNSLDDALSQVQSSVDQVSAGSGQISSGSQTLSQGAQEQASSLEEVSSSLEEMASMTKQNSENANQAKTLAGAASNSAAQGNEAMGKMSESIDMIKKSSDETAKIVKTIDEIAFQTNLLALNAAVEAARAGEAGRGFAVVAEEVRNLAGRSAEAAKNTADMIEESVKNADGGVTISQEVAKFLSEITEGSGKVNDLVAEIAAASDEQTKGIEQVNVAVGQMNNVTQQNASNSEESASAAEEMSSQAQELQAMIGTFQLSNKAVTGKSTNHLAFNQNQPQLKQKAIGSPNNGEAQVADPEVVIPMNDTELNGF
jgi:methyl-accepting chemotaxis protein